MGMEAEIRRYYQLFKDVIQRVRHKKAVLYVQ